MILHFIAAHPVRTAAMTAALLAIWLLLTPSGTHAAGLLDDGTQVHLPMVMTSPPLVSPAITSLPPSTGVIGELYSYTVATNGYPTPALSLASGPAGMTMDGNGRIEWTPTTAGTFGVIILAVNGIIPDAEQFFEIEVAPGPSAPAIISTPALSASADLAYTYAVQTTGFPPPAISLDSAPDGMVVDGDGVIRWTPSAEGVYDVTVRAANEVSPDALQSFSIAVAAAPLSTPPAIISTPIVDATVDELYAYQLQITGYPPSNFWFNVKPDGMTVSGNGLIQWTPNAAGDFDVTVRAGNGIMPNAAQSFIIHVEPQTVAPAITSAPTAFVAVGDVYAYQVQASGYPTPVLTLDIGPAGMVMDGNGLVQWTPTAAGSYAVSVHAGNGVFPDAEQSFAIEVTPPPSAPTITSTPVLNGTAGEAYVYQAQATGYPAPTFWCETKPPGMTVSSDGLIQWTPGAAGKYYVTLRASNGILPHASQSFTVDVALPERIWDPRLDQRFASLVEADVPSGQMYWRLIEAQWLDIAQSDGSHHIFVDTLDLDGVRKVGVRLRISWADGSYDVWSEAKSGEPYAANYPMGAELAPSYNAEPYGALAADRVEGMGLGTIEDPWHTHHTSYELTWQLTVMP